MATRLPWEFWMAVLFLCLPHLGMGHLEKTGSPDMSKGSKQETRGRSWVILELLSLPTWETSLKVQPCNSHDLSQHFGTGLRHGGITRAGLRSRLSQLSLTHTFRAPPLVSPLFHAQKSCSRWTQLASV